MGTKISSSGTKNLLTIWCVSLLFLLSLNERTRKLPRNWLAKIIQFGWNSHINFVALFFRSFLASIHCRWKVVNFTLCREYSLRFPLSLSFSNARRSRCRTMNSFYALEKLWSNFRIFFRNKRQEKQKYYHTMNKWFTQIFAGFYSIAKNVAKNPNSVWLKNKSRFFQWNWLFSSVHTYVYNNGRLWIKKSVWFSRRRSSTTANSTSGCVMRLGQNRLLFVSLVLVPCYCTIHTYNTLVYMEESLSTFVYE